MASSLRDNRPRARGGSSRSLVSPDHNSTVIAMAELSLKKSGSGSTRRTDARALQDAVRPDSTGQSLPPRRRQSCDNMHHPLSNRPSHTNIRLDAVRFEHRAAVAAA
jgi:hypothetical protein